MHHIDSEGCKEWAWLRFKPGDGILYVAVKVPSSGESESTVREQ